MSRAARGLSRLLASAGSLLFILACAGTPTSVSGERGGSSLESESSRCAAPPEALRLPATEVEPPSLARQVIPSLPPCRGSRIVELRPFLFEVSIDREGRGCILALRGEPKLDPPCPAFRKAYESALSNRLWSPARRGGLAVPVVMSVEMQVYPAGMPPRGSVAPSS